MMRCAALLCFTAVQKLVHAVNPCKHTALELGCLILAAKLRIRVIDLLCDDVDNGA